MKNDCLISLEATYIALDNVDNKIKAAESNLAERRNKYNDTCNIIDEALDYLYNCYICDKSEYRVIKFLIFFGGNVSDKILTHLFKKYRSIALELKTEEKDILLMYIDRLEYHASIFGAVSIEYGKSMTELSREKEAKRKILRKIGIK